MTIKRWTGKKVLVTGGAGFLGSYLVAALRKKGATVFVPRSSSCDLRIPDNCRKIVKHIDIVFHLAAKVGGIGYNRMHPAEMYYDNMVMGAHLMHEAYLARVKKFIAIGTICAYPKYTPVPFREEDLWSGYPEETNAPYGLAKKMLLVQAQSYRQQYGFSAIYLLPVNLYGPGDNFDPESSHVIPALIRKFVEAKMRRARSVTVWGSGTATREFLFVEDAVRGILLASERYDKGYPVNLGSGSEISIRELVQQIKKLVGFKGRIQWDRTKPDGQPRRKLCTDRAQAEFGFRAQVPFLEGLKRMVDWYIRNLNLV